MVNERELAVIKALTEAKGPSGFEDEAVAAARESLSDICDFEEDSLRNLYIYRRANTGNKPVLMLDAHSDEVGFIVHSIKPNGTLRFLELGGWSKNTLPGTRVLVRNKDGEPAVPATPFEYDEARDIMFGKGFDCRIGCAALIETMRLLSGMELDVDVIGVLSAQEEVGERGCKVAVNKVRPNIAIVYEGCPADDTFGEAYAMQTIMKKGPMLRYMDKSVICNPRFQRFALDTAEKNGLMAQASVREGGGNNAAVIQAQLAGAPSIVMGVPVRYIHGPSCITTYTDYDATVKLACAIARALNADIIKSF